MFGSLIIELSLKMCLRKYFQLSDVAGGEKTFEHLTNDEEIFHVRSEESELFRLISFKFLAYHRRHRRRDTSARY